MIHSRLTALARCGLAQLVLLGAFVPVASAQTTYYVAANGSDSNDGRSVNSPYQSLAKVNTLPLQPGDQVLFRRGDTFRGGVVVRRSGTDAQPITFDAYGAGARPIISGSTLLTNWTSLGNNRWQTTCTACAGRVTGLYRHDNALPLGRYPNGGETNKGYLTIQSHQGRAQITSQQGIPLNLNTGWNGAEVVIRATQWITDRYGLSSQSGNSLNLTSAGGGYGLQDGWGYFVQNHPAALDQEGEWAFDASSKQIQLYDASGDPNTQAITVATAERAVELVNAANVTLRNLNLTQSLGANLSVSSGSNLTFSNLDILNAGEDGVSITGSGRNVLIENSTIQYVNNNGVGIGGYQNVTFRGNTLRHVGIDAGRSKNGDGQANGLQTSVGQGMLIENNVIDSIGYNAISYTNGTTIRKNVISNFCLTKSDGGAIYVWNGNKNTLTDIHVVSNIIYNGIGAPEGTPGGGYSGANGIYFDDCTQNAEVTNNTIFNCTGLGIFLHATSNLTLTNNTSYNNGEGQLSMHDNNGNCSIRGNTIQNNVFASRLPTQFVAKFESNTNDLNQYGTFDNNFYIRPFEDVFKVRAVWAANGRTTVSDLPLAQWQSQFNQDLHTQNSPLTYPTTVLTPTGTVLRNDAFTSDSNGWGVWSPYSNGRVDRDDAGKLDGGSLRMSFPNASNQANSYMLVTAGMGSVSKGKTYQVDFDAIGTGAKRVEVFIRQQSGSYSDLAPRSILLVSAARQHYTAAFTATTDEANAILVFQVYEDGQTAWIDNLKLQGATATPNNPDDFMRLVYNATDQSTSVSMGGNWRDARNQVYAGSATLAPFSSLLLLKDNAPTAPTPTPVTLRDPENPANAVNGLDYQYYEGIWLSIPDFSKLTPAKTGTAGSVDLSVRSRDDLFGMRYQGYVNIPTDGLYTFYTASDDGSKLLIGTTEVVNNDGLHATQEQSGTIGLKAGKHALTLLYIQGGGGQVLTASYAGPGLSKQVIPAASFYRLGIVSSTPTPTLTPTPTPTPPPAQALLRDPENPANTTNGLDYQYYEGKWVAIPAFSTLTPKKTGIIPGPDLSVRSRDELYAVNYQGYVNIPVDGMYTFYTTSDDGSRVLIGATEVVNNDGLHATQEQSGTIGLKAGKHALAVQFLQGGGGQTLTVSYAGPGIMKQVIPVSSFYRATATTPTPPVTTPTPTPTPAGGTGTGLLADYFNNRTLIAPASVNRIDATVDFNWGDGSPAGSVPTDNFSVRWTGQVEAPVSGNYTFSTISDDGVRLWVNNTLIINNWTSHAAVTDNSPVVVLTAGQKYDIKMEYFENGGGAVARLLWTYPGQSQQAVPKSRLYPATGTTTPVTPTPPAGTGVYLSDLTWVSATSAFGPVERDHSTGDSGAGDGHTITLNGVTYAKGLGTHAPSEIVYTLGGQYTRFITDMGIDDEMNTNGCGSVEFKIYVDNVLMYSSGVMTVTTATKSVTLDVTGKQTLKLVLTTGGDNYNCDHGDWAGARLIGTGSGRLAAPDADIQAEVTVQVYPVPARDELQISYPSDVAGDLSLQLINAVGQPVKQTVQPLSAGPNLIRLPVQDVSRGLYILNLIQGNRRTTRKVLLAE